MPVNFQSKKKFKLDSANIYEGFIFEVKFKEKKDYKMYEVWAEIFSKVPLLEPPDKHSVGIQVKYTLWLDDKGLFNFKDKPFITAIAKAKDLNITDDSFKIEDLVGAIIGFKINNDDAGYSTINRDSIEQPDEELLSTYHAYIEWKKEKEIKENKQKNPFK